MEPWKSKMIRALASPLFELQWANAEFAVLRLRDSKAPNAAWVSSNAVSSVELRGFSSKISIAAIGRLTYTNPIFNMWL